MRVSAVAPSLVRLSCMVRPRLHISANVESLNSSSATYHDHEQKYH